MMLLVTGFQKPLLCSDTMSSACSRVTFVNSVEIRRAGKSGSKTTVIPASLPIVSKIVFASLVIGRSFRRNQFQGLANFLLGNGARRVNSQRLLKLGHG